MPRDQEGSIRYRSSETPEVPEITQEITQPPEPVQEPAREAVQPPGAQPVGPPAQPPAQEAERVPNDAETVLNRPPLVEVGVQAAEKVAQENVRMYPDPEDADVQSEEA